MVTGDVSEEEEEEVRLINLPPSEEGNQEHLFQCSRSQGKIFLQFVLCCFGQHPLIVHALAPPPHRLCHVSIVLLPPSRVLGAANLNLPQRRLLGFLRLCCSSPPRPAPSVILFLLGGDSSPHRQLLHVPPPACGSSVSPVYPVSSLSLLTPAPYVSYFLLLPFPVVSEGEILPEDPSDLVLHPSCLM